MLQWTLQGARWLEVTEVRIMFRQLFRLQAYFTVGRHSNCSIASPLYHTEYTVWSAPSTIAYFIPSNLIRMDVSKNNLWKCSFQVRAVNLTSHTNTLIQQESLEERSFYRVTLFIDYQLQLWHMYVPLLFVWQVHICILATDDKSLQSHNCCMWIALHYNTFTRPANRFSATLLPHKLIMKSYNVLHGRKVRPVSLRGRSIQCFVVQKGSVGGRAAAAVSD